MIVILSNMNIDLTVDEFIELNQKMGLFFNVEKPEPKEQPVEKPEPEETPVDEEILESMDLVTANELSEYLKVAPCTINKYRLRGMPYVSVPRGTSIGYRYNKEACREWQEKNIDQSYNHNAPKREKVYDNGLVGTDQIAKYLGVGVSTIWIFRKDGMPCKEIVTESGRKKFLYDKNVCASWYRMRKDASINPKNVINNYDIKRSISDYTLWKSEINKMCREAEKDTGKMLSLTYKYMTKNYGVVWDQEAKDFAEANGYRPHSTSQLAHWVETTKPAYKNLVKSCLSTIIKEQIA